MIGVYEIGGTGRRDNTLLCRPCAERLHPDEHAVDGVEGECDECGTQSPA